jgi:hypothetical protein
MQTYQIKGAPANVKQRLVQVPLLCFAREQTKTGRVVERRVQDRVLQIETLEKLGAVVLYQDITSGEERSAIIEKVQFVAQNIRTKQLKPDADGGILTITLRLVD